MSDGVLPAASGIGRVALRVADIDRVAGFYESVVGLERLDGAADRLPDPVAGSADAPSGEAPPCRRAVLGAGDEPLLVLLEDADAPARGDRAAGLYHLAIRVPDRAALGAALERLRDAGALHGASDHRVSEALYFSDPEGNGVEVYADRPREAWPLAKSDEERGDAGDSADERGNARTDADERGNVSMDADEHGEPSTDADGRDAPPRVRMATERLDLADVLAASDGADGVPAGTDVGHVHLEVTSLADARAFYVDALGTNVRAAYGDAALFVAAGDYHHHVGLNTWQRRSVPAGDGRGLAWYEVVVPDDAALDDAVERLAAAEHAPERTSDGARVADPDGIELRLRVGD